MKDCKHRWIEAPIPKACRAKYIFMCKRCFDLRFVK